MARKILTWLLILFLVSGCAASGGDADARRMEGAALGLMDILWNVDFETFTPEKTTSFAKEYYDTDFLEDYLQDIETNAGVYAVREDKLVSHLFNAKIVGQGEELLGDTLYKTCTVQASIKIIRFEPLYPEENYFEEGREYALLYTLYFKRENGVLKLSAFGFMPENEPFLPKKANNKTLDESEIRKIDEILNAYFTARYEVDYRTFDPAAVMDFYKKNLTRELLEKQGITKAYLERLAADYKAYKLTSRIINIRIRRADRDKSAVYTIEGEEYYYLITVEVTYTISADDAYFVKTGVQKGEENTMRETLGFAFKEGGLQIAFTEHT